MDIIGTESVASFPGPPPPKQQLPESIRRHFEPNEEPVGTESIAGGILVDSRPMSERLRALCKDRGVACYISQ